MMDVTGNRFQKAVKERLMFTLSAVMLGLSITVITIGTMDALIWIAILDRKREREDL